MTEKQEEYAATKPEMDRSQSLAIFRLLSEPMPQEALNEDNSRGFVLTSIKAGFILERLNLSFGLLGYGWRYVHSPHHIETAGGKDEVLVEVALQWRLTDAEAGCPPIYWGRSDLTDSMVSDDWYMAIYQPSVWSEPVFANGGAAANRTGSTPLNDAYRSAVTNGITKAAARLGVGNEIFKGQNHASPQKETTRRKKAARVKNGGICFLTLTAMQQAAQRHVERLTEVEEQDANPSITETLARTMKKMGLEMQPVRLLSVLLGNGPFTTRRVMAVYNFLLSGKTKLTEENLGTLTAAAWEEPWKTEENKAKDN